MSSFARPLRRRQYINYEPTVSLGIYFGFVSSFGSYLYPEMFIEKYSAKIYFLKLTVARS